VRLVAFLSDGKPHAGVCTPEQFARWLTANDFPTPYAAAMGASSIDPAAGARPAWSKRPSDKAIERNPSSRSDQSPSALATVDG
jgi:hypothetical protein